MADVNVEPVYPPESSKLSIDELIRHLPELDALLADQEGQAARPNKRVHNRAVVEPGEQIAMAFQEVPADSALAELNPLAAPSSQIAS
jgi:hypothetical protein